MGPYPGQPLEIRGTGRPNPPPSPLSFARNRNRIAGIATAHPLDDFVIRSMLIRMTLLGTHIAAVLAAGAVATGAAFGAETGTDDAGTRTALVIDASLASHGRDLVDPRLDNVDAEVRLPRNATEARTNVRYFDELDYHVYVAGAQATGAAEETGVDATPVEGLAGALAAVR